MNGNDDLLNQQGGVGHVLTNTLSDFSGEDQPVHLHSTPDKLQSTVSPPSSLEKLMDTEVKDLKARGMTFGEVENLAENIIYQVGEKETVGFSLEQGAQYASLDEEDGAQTEIMTEVDGFQCKLSDNIALEDGLVQL